MTTPFRWLSLLQCAYNLSICIHKTVNRHTQGLNIQFEKHMRNYLIVAYTLVLLNDYIIRVNEREGIESKERQRRRMILTWCPYIETIVFVHPIYIFAYRLTTLKKINFALVCVCVCSCVRWCVLCVAKNKSQYICQADYTWVAPFGWIKIDTEKTLRAQLIVAKLKWTIKTESRSLSLTKKVSCDTEKWNIWFGTSQPTPLIRIRQRYVEANSKWKPQNALFQQFFLPSTNKCMWTRAQQQKG